MATAGDVITYLDTLGPDARWTPAQLAEATGAPMRSVMYALNALDERGWAGRVSPDTEEWSWT